MRWAAVKESMIAGPRRRYQAYTRTRMAEKAPKRKAKPERGQAGVLSTLPRTRPERMGRPRRNGAEPPAKAPAPRRPAARGTGTAGKPKAVRPACEPLRARRVAGEPEPKSIGAPTGTELVTTTIRAAGELAQIGFTVGGQVLKRTIDRIPRP
jgi:hypothetical protein